MRQNGDIVHALNLATKKKQSCITLCIGMAHLDFKHEFIATNLDALGPKTDTSNNPRPEDKHPETPNSATSKLIKTFTEPIKEITNPTKAQSLTEHSDLAPVTPPSASLDLFNTNALPLDVQQWCDAKTRGEPPCQNEMKPFRSNTPEVRNPSEMQAMHHCLDPPSTGNRLITRDGTVFHPQDHGPESNQMFMLLAQRCKGNKLEETQAWCLALTKFAAAKGNCVHPCFCF